MNCQKSWIALLIWVSVISPTLAATSPQVSGAETKQDGGSASQSYLVKPGDIFGKICQQFQPEGVPLKEVMRLVFEQNPNAFKGHDPAQIIVGSRLVIPSMFLGKPAKNPNQVASPQAMPTQTNPQEPGSARPTKAVQEKKVVEEKRPVDKAKVTGQEESAEIVTSQAPQSDLQTKNGWLKPSLIVLLVLVLVGAYLRKRKLLIEARQKALEELMVVEPASQVDSSIASDASKA